MKPYYQDDSCTIYHGDAYEIFPKVWFGSDLCLTDPPYGINLDTDYRSLNGSTKNYDRVVGDDVPFDPSPFLCSPKSILWGANHYAHMLPSSSGWLVWDKRAGKQNSNMFSDAEMAWCSFKTPVRVFRHLWGVNRDSERGFNVHPTQKPVALMRWVLEQFTKPDQLVIDPFMGSGPVARACLETGRRYVGIEINESYCEVAANRLGQGSLGLGA